MPSSRDDLFPTLSSDEIECLRAFGTPVAAGRGEALFVEGQPEHDLYVILEGELKVTRSVAGEDTLLTVHRPGEFTGALSLLTGELSIATARAVVDSRALRVSEAGFFAMLGACPEIARKILTAMARRRPEADALTQQREKMAALGKLSAGLAHELNNPAAAARRAAARLRGGLETLQRSSFALGERGLTEAQKDALLGLQADARPPGLGALALSEREDALADWLDAHGVDDSCALAGALAEGGLTEDALEALAHALPAPDALAEGAAWLGSSLDAVELLRTVEGSGERISDLVSAIKAYTYMDQAPRQEVDVRESLESTLTILRFKWKHGVEVVRDYAPGLPRITAYGSELNQVWTNLMDNALDALDGKGRLTVRAAREADWLLVEIGDDGPGIAPDVLPRVFEPFFTTKGVGEGTGLGLDTAYRIVVGRHHGDLRVVSSPGDTRFQVRLPLNDVTEHDTKEDDSKGETHDG